MKREEKEMRILVSNDWFMIPTVLNLPATFKEVINNTGRARSLILLGKRKR